MAIEVEQKFAVADVQALEQKLAQLGALPGDTELQVDRYYGHPQRDFAATDEALRVRRDGQMVYLTYKGPKLDQTTKTRREIELLLGIGDGTQADASSMLEILGFRPVAEVRKTRRAFSISQPDGREIHILLDSVDRVGDYVEIEMVVDEAGTDAARAAVAKLAERLGLSQGERRSYLELLLSSQSR